MFSYCGDVNITYMYLFSSLYVCSLVCHWMHLQGPAAISNHFPHGELCTNCMPAPYFTSVARFSWRHFSSLLISRCWPLACQDSITCYNSDKSASREIYSQYLNPPENLIKFCNTLQVISGYCGLTVARIMLSQLRIPWLFLSLPSNFLVTALQHTPWL